MSKMLEAQKAMFISISQIRKLCRVRLSGVFEFIVKQILGKEIKTTKRPVLFSVKNLP